LYVTDKTDAILGQKSTLYPRYNHLKKRKGAIPFWQTYIMYDSALDQFYRSLPPLTMQNNYSNNSHEPSTGPRNTFDFLQSNKSKNIKLGVSSELTK